jgi:hypothetical protein
VASIRATASNGIFGYCIVTVGAAAPTTQDNNIVTVYITETGSSYHRAGCRYLSQSSIAISLQNAKTQGYAPCSVCKPPE